MIKFLREQDAGTLREVPVGSEVVYAKQVPPEYQESPFDETMFGPGEYWDGVCIFADYYSYDYRYKLLSDDMERLIKAITTGILELTPSWEMEEPGESYPLEDALAEEIPPRNKAEYSREEVAEWQELWEEWDGLDPEWLARAMTLMTGNEWECGRLHGSVQRDIATVVYDTTKIDKKDLEILEIEFFNTGTDFQVEIDGEYELNVYCYSWDEEDMKKEIADAVGCNPEDVILDTYY